MAKLAQNVLSDEAFTRCLERAVLHVKSNGTLKNSELRRLTGIDYDQAIWFFNHAIELGVLKRTGSAGGARYLLVEK